MTLLLNAAMTLPKNATRFIVLCGVFNATAAAAQTGPPYLVINNTSQSLLCSTRVPNGIWQDWFELKPAANWTSASGNDQLDFQCRPPVAQVSYSLKPQVRYSLLQSGTEITLVEVAFGPAR